MAGRLYKPNRAKSFWILVRRLLLLRKNHKQTPPRPAEEEEKSGLLSRSSLEELLLTDGAPHPEDAPAAGCRRCALEYAKKQHDLQVTTVEAAAAGGWAGLHRPVMARSEAAAGGGSSDGGAAAPHRRFMFGGFRRRLLMRRPWRPMLVAIPE